VLDVLERCLMVAVPGGVRVWLANGPTDMGRGMNSLALQAIECTVRHRASLRRPPDLVGQRLCDHNRHQVRAGRTTVGNIEASKTQSPAARTARHWGRRQ
jgi:hypothetical protein